MAKGGKSSASSATRKKQAAKAAKKAGIEAPAPAGKKQQQPAQRGQKKDKKDKKQPKKKVFVPPPKPPQPAPDPLDALGLAAHLPPDLVVHLRKASKKDVLTRQRALEGLQGWIRGEDADEDGATAMAEEERVSALVLMLPSWVHIFPRLSISPTRRLRLLTAQILSELLALPDVRAELLFSPQYAEALIGPWAVLAWDTDRQVSKVAREAWDKSVSWQSGSEDAQPESSAAQKLNLYDQLAPLLSHLSVLLLTVSPSTVLAHNAPHLPTPAASGANDRAAIAGPDSSLRDAKNRDDTVEEDVAATDRRLAAGALGSFAWVVSSHPAPLPAEPLERLTTSPSLWSALAPIRFELGGSEEEQLPFLGLASPPTRQRAWDLLKALAAADAELVQTQVLSIVAPVALVSAWEERDQLVQKNMLVSLLPLLRALPETWQTADAALGGDDAGDEDSDEEDEEDEDEDDGDDDAEGTAAGAGRKSAGDKGTASSSPSFAAFERWIQTGCGGSPELCLPTVVLFLATAPAAVLPISRPAASRFLNDFGKALHGGALDSRPGVTAYISAFCDCAIFLTHRLLKGTDSGTAAEEASALVSEQLGALWDELVLGIISQSNQGQPASGRAADLVSERALNPLVDCIEQVAGFAEGGAQSSAATLDRICSSTRQFSRDAAATLSNLRAGLGRAMVPLQKLQQSSKLSEVAKASIADLILDLAATSLDQLAAADGQQAKAAVLLLSDLLKRFAPVFATKDAVLERALAAGSAEIPSLFASGTITARETITVLAALSGVSERAAATMQDIWPRMVQVVLQLPDAATQAGAVVELLPAVRNLGKTGPSLGTSASEAALPAALRTALSDIAVDLTQKLCEGDASAASFPQAELSAAIGGIVSLPPTHVDLEPLGEAMALLTSLIEHAGTAVLASAAGDLELGQGQEAQLPFALEVLGSWLSGSSSAEAKTMMHAGDAWSVVPIVFALAQPDVSVAPGVSTSAAASKVWAVLRSDAEAVQSVDSYVQKQSRETTFNVLDVLRLAQAAASCGDGAASQERLAALLPDDAGMSQSAKQVVRCAPTLPILAIVDPLVPLTESSNGDASTEDATFDHEGLSPYVRSVQVHLHLCENDRARRNRSAWLLPHLILLGVICEDRLLYGSAWRSELAAACSTELIGDILDRSIKTATAILSALASTLDSSWHASITGDLPGSKTSASDNAGLASVTRNVFAATRESKSASQYRVFSRLLSGLLTFSSAEAQDAERWLRLAQQLQAQESQLAQAIVLPAKALALGTPLHERLCNEVASRLAGVSPAKANTDGVALLQMANAVAPPTNSEHGFIPQQRAIFLLQALQKWIASDEDLDEEINAHLAQLFIHLVPIVQGMRGSHLDFFFDVIETNLDVALESVDEDNGIPAVFHTLKLLDKVVDLAGSNAVFREAFEERQAGINELLSKLFTALAPSASSADKVRSVPREICNNLLVELIHRIPEGQRASLVNNPEVLSTLLGHRVQPVQVIAYRLLSAYIHERVQAAIVEAAVEKDAASAAEVIILPSLVAKATRPVDELLAQSDDVAARHDIFGFFLAWLAILDHFEEGSLQLKSVYLAQLQKSDAATVSLLPVIFGLMASTQHDLPFDASKVSVDEIFLDDLELSRIFTLQALAGHVFYRTLIHMPGLVRDWWRSIKNRQVSMQVAAFTSRHCSPLLAAKEFAHLRTPDALEQVQDDMLAVRVLSGTNEVIATYTIDEHPMEIGIRLPADYPLHGAEIRDIKRVGGVSERQWRAWLLAVQQIISSRNGLVFDALMLFKKNAEAKFSGFEGKECAICYSIISPIDEGLPTKPCKTCKNAFHSSCLLKWVVQSGSSTCPLCRSII